MKKLSMMIWLLGLCLSAEVIANVAFNVEGELKVSKLSAQSMKVSLVTTRGTFEIAKPELEQLSCKKGTFQIVSNYVPFNTYSILRVVACEELLQGNNDKDGMIALDRPEPRFCPEVYSPVCAQPRMPACPEGQLCAQVMPQPKTFSNICKMKGSGATLLFKGECRSMDHLNNLAVFPSLSRSLLEKR